MKFGAIEGSRVKALRKAHNWTQEDLVQQVQAIVGEGRLARQTLIKIEKDKYDAEPGVWLLLALAKTLGTTPHYLLGITDDPGMPVPASDKTSLSRREAEIIDAVIEALQAMGDEEQEVFASFISTFFAVKEDEEAEDEDLL